MSNLFKAKIVTRNGVPYYADGKHAGKRVGSVRNSKGKTIDEALQDSKRKAINASGMARVSKPQDEKSPGELGIEAARSDSKTRASENMSKLIEDSGFKYNAMSGSSGYGYYSRKKPDGVNEFIMMDYSNGKYYYMEKPNARKIYDESIIKEILKN